MVWEILTSRTEAKNTSVQVAEEVRRVRDLLRAYTLKLRQITINLQVLRRKQTSGAQ
jgi:hypothetical protein